MNCSIDIRLKRASKEYAEGVFLFFFKNYEKENINNFKLGHCFGRYYNYRQQ
jgi:hypothetical protein